MLTKHIETTILIGTIGLLQWHGGWFWYNQIGWTGVLSSVLVEITALYLWYRRGFWNTTAALIGSLIIIGGPLYNVASPLATTSVAASADLIGVQQQIQAARNEIIQGTDTLNTYLKNSEQRGGWLPAMNRQNEQLDAARARLNTLLNKQGSLQRTTQLQWLTIAAISLQALFLIFLQTAQIAIARRWGNARNVTPKPINTATQRPATVARNVTATPEPAKHPVQPGWTADDEAKALQVRDAVLAKKYQGADFTVRNIIDTEKVRHKHVKAAFDQMVIDGLVERNGNKHRMVKV